MLAALLAGCGSVATRKPEPPVPAASTSRPGGYYQDDGPGDRSPAELVTIPDAEPRVEPLHRFANNPYQALGQNYTPLRELRAYRERGMASWYGRKFHGQRTSSGEPYDMYAMTAAHPVLPIPSYARVTNPGNGRSVIVRINDRGPFRPGRVIDLSYAAAHKLGYASAGSTLVDVDAITPEAMPQLARRTPPPAPEATPNPEAQHARSGADPAAILAGADPGALADAGGAAPAPGAAAAAGAVYLQLGAFSGKDNAESFRQKIGSQLGWLDRAIELLQRDGLFRVRLGPYRDRAEAGGIAERIREALDLKAVLVFR